MSPYLRAQRLVDVGGRRLNMYCSGQGSPVVILDSGLGGTTEDWYRIQPAIAKRTRVCSYDRAGMGFSDGTKARRDPNAVVVDLHTLLKRANIAPPYVLVGHSIAGLYEPLYADRYPGEVAGMVLVDPSRPFQQQRFTSAAPTLVREWGKTFSAARRCYASLSGNTHGAQEQRDCGFLTPLEAQRLCQAGGPQICAVIKLQDRQTHNPMYWYDSLSELDSVWGGGGGSREVQRAQRSYGSMPLIVLTADDGPNHGRGLPSNVPSSQLSAQWTAWKDMHDQLAGYSSVGVNFVVPNTGHYIHQDQPSAVISAIDEVIAQIRR